MSIEINDGTIALWSVHGRRFNLLMHLGRDTDGKLQMDYRFRHYRDNKTGPESTDQKNFYRAFMVDNEAIAVQKCREVFEKFRDSCDGLGWELIRGARTQDEFIALFMTMPGIKNTTSQWPAS